MCVVASKRCRSCRPPAPRRSPKGMVVQTETDEDCAGSQSHPGTTARQPSARLPGLRRRRRVRIAGHDLQVRRRRSRSTPRSSSIATSSSGRRWSSSTVRAASSAIAAYACAAKAWTSGRSAFRTAASAVIAPNVGDHLDCEAVRHVHRHLPGRRAHLRHLSL